MSEVKASLAIAFPAPTSIPLLFPVGYMVDIHGVPKTHWSNAGCAAAWVDTVEKLGSGRLSLADVLEPAIRLAEGGCVPMLESAIIEY